MRPELLYLKQQPYSRLHVEVDTIEGVEVPDRWLDVLKAFLGEYCSKPDGIEIVRDKPVPISEIENLPMSLASILCIDGPDPNSRAQPAYLHVFFCDTDMGFWQKSIPPRVPQSCPCMIFFDVGYFHITKGKTEMSALKHESGHVLGLCKNTTHCDGAHCRNHGCVMCAMPDLLSQVALLVGSGLDWQLCADCRHDLEVWRSEDVDPNLVFKGPFLIRREDGYFVASLPYCDLIILSPMEDMFDWQEVLLQIKEQIRQAYRRKDSKEYRESKKALCHIATIYIPATKGVLPLSTTEALAILTKAADDPCPLIRRVANTGLKELRKRQGSQDK
jgi:hypothetical protein